MAGGFSAVDLSQLPAPSVVEVLDYESVLEAMLTDLRARDASFTAITEADPAYKILETAAYRELILRQRINEAAQSVMLAYALSTDLDNLGALLNVTRLETDAGDPDAVPPIAASYETDDALRRRIQLALEGFSVAGPEGAYIFHALSADGEVLDASAISPNPGEVLVTVLARTGSGEAPQSLLDTVDATLNAEDVRPLTDQVSVQSATINEYSVQATLYFYSGPDRSLVLAEAQSAIDAYTAQQHRIGLDVTLSGIYAALHQQGVQRVELSAPTDNIVIDAQSAAYCTDITLTDGGIDE